MRINDYINVTDRIEPSEKCRERILASGRNTEKPEKRRKSLKRGIVVAVSLLLFGRIGVYAASEITYKDLFSDTIHVANHELADSLMGTVSGFEYNVSDDDYVIRILGVTGGSEVIKGRAEIYRKDGKPVKDFYNNYSDEKGNLYPSLKYQSLESSGGVGCEFDENGNIRIEWELESAKKFNGRKLSFSGADFFYADDMISFTESNNVFFDIDQGKAYLKDKDTNEFSDISYDEIVGLKLNWSFSFRYNQSSVSRSSKKCSSFSENFILKDEFSIYRIGSDKVGNLLESIDSEVECIPLSMKFSSVGGTMKFKYSYKFPFDEYVAEKYNGLNIINSCYLKLGRPDCSMYLIKKDGTHINMRISSYSESGSDYIMKTKAHIEYFDPELGDSGNQIYTDISDVVSAYINGTTYTLK